MSVKSGAPAAMRQCDASVQRCRRSVHLVSLVRGRLKVAERLPQVPYRVVTPVRAVPGGCCEHRQREILRRDQALEGPCPLPVADEGNLLPPLR